MKTKIAIAAVGLAALTAGCGTTQGDRTMSGAVVGAGTGAIVGPVGAGVGAVVGAGVGYVTDREDLYLGKPVWRDGKSKKRK